VPLRRAIADLTIIDSVNTAIARSIWRNPFRLTYRSPAVIFYDVIHAGFQTRMAMMRALHAGAAVSLAVCV
jgi:hypothetical protein